MASIFTKIIEGEFPGQFVWQDDQAVGLLSINPLRPGHTLIIPRKEVDHWLDLDNRLRAHLMTVAHTVGMAIQAVYQPEKVGLMIAGLEVPHTHIHLVPIWEVNDLDFARAGSATQEELGREAERIRGQLA
jgi:diadenosine tetraphosphate (Ap4A) HIT family hydrolase